MPKVLNYKIDTIPSDAIKIMRGSKWGNPFVIGVRGNRDKVCDLYEEYAEREFSSKDYEELRGKDLVCCCKPLRCHGDFLLERANASS